MDCDDLDDLDIGVRLGGSTYKINPSDLDLGEFTSGTCVIGVIAADTQDLEGNYLGILGAAFLKNASSLTRSCCDLITDVCVSRSTRFTTLRAKESAWLSSQTSTQTSRQTQAAQTTIRTRTAMTMTTQLRM